MPQTDGQIESKQLGTASVNSRVIDDLRSSNYDGSRTDPETTPGTQGWQILKSGFMVINQAIIRGTLQAAKILSGTLNIGTGGSLTVGGDVETGVAPITILDEAKLRFNRTDGTRILEVTPGGGMKLYAANGTTVLATFDGSGIQVGSDVVIDSTGLFLDGGPARALDIGTALSSGGNVSLSTTWNNFATEAITVPAWALSLSVSGTLTGQISGSAAQTFELAVTTTASAPGGGGAQISSVSGETRQVTHPWRRTFASPGSTVSIYYWARVTSGTNSSNGFNAPLIWFVTR